MEDDLSQFTRMVLVSASNGFFETEEEHFLMSLKEEVQRVSLCESEFERIHLLFTEKYADYHGIVEKMYRFCAPV